jgi:hypothetical protein
VRVLFDEVAKGPEVGKGGVKEGSGRTWSVGEVGAGEVDYANEFGRIERIGGGLWFGVVMESHLEGVGWVGWRCGCCAVD